MLKVLLYIIPIDVCFDPVHFGPDPTCVNSKKYFQNMSIKINPPYSVLFTVHYLHKINTPYSIMFTVHYSHKINPAYSVLFTVLYIIDINDSYRRPVTVFHICICFILVQMTKHLIFFITHSAPLMYKLIIFFFTEIQ